MDNNQCNSRVEEFDFLITIMNDLSRNYNDHNSKVLDELVSNLRYRKTNEETTVKARCVTINNH